MEKDKLEGYFEKQLDTTNMWLSFAEAKNAALIAFNVAMISVIFDVYSNCSFFGAILFFLYSVSTIICLVSFRPKVMNRPTKYKQNTSSNNLLFWGDIAYFQNEVDYIESVIQRYFSHIMPDEAKSNKNIDFASEIIINSRITSRKYMLFKWALYVDFLAIILAVLFMIIA